MFLLSFWSGPFLELHSRACKMLLSIVQQLVKHAFKTMSRTIQNNILRLTFLYSETNTGKPREEWKLNNRESFRQTMFKYVKKKNPLID